jgi:hypothetical protein
MSSPVVLLPEWLDPAHEFPRPDWARIWTWVEERFAPGERDRVYQDLGRDWAARIARSFPDSMRISESPHFLLVAPSILSKPANCLQQLESYHRQICEALAGLDLAAGYGKELVVLAPNLDGFTRYLAGYYPDGSYMMPGGVCLRAGYTHFIVLENDLTRAAPTLAHELTHARVSGLPWPAWVDEAVAQTVEYRVSRTNPYVLDASVIERHRRYWNPTRMQGFWTGDSFHATDEGSELSYHLSRFLLESVAQGGRPGMLEFLRTAQAKDAGFGAYWKVVGVFPHEVLADFLGPKDWSFQSG